ncbi:MAG: 4Fe-4S dicluster domain-containing protein [Clostridia bacterium]|nr:MAG: 4Fe-4S dicluster domain-containing protein [Clostridia bacterium]
MKRLVINIDEDKCTGCGICVPGCAESALQIVDGKARLVSAALCDGMGACIEQCPEGALTVEEREAEEFDPEAVEAWQRAQEGPAGVGLASGLAGPEVAGDARLYPPGTAGVAGEASGSGPAGAHAEAREIPRGPEGGGVDATGAEVLPCGCPSAAARVIEREPLPTTRGLDPGHGPAVSHLAHWPVQLALVSPKAPFFRGAELLVAADCVPFACADFHQALLRGRALVVGCPKLDDAEAYVEKLAGIIALNDLAGITIAHMEVGCCYGLERIVRAAVARAGAKLPVRSLVVTVDGMVEGEEAAG